MRCSYPTAFTTIKGAEKMSQSLDHCSCEDKHYLVTLVPLKQSMIVCGKNIAIFAILRHFVDTPILEIKEVDN